MKVSVIGAAGSVGSAVAFYIAASGLAEEIVLCDVRGNQVKQHALDIGTAVSALDIRVKAGDYEDLARSDLVINAAGMLQGLIADRMEMLPRNIPLVRDIALQIKHHCPAAVIITATNPVDPLNYATWRAGGFDRRQIVGYSINDSFRFRELAARSKNVRVSQVQATVIGEAAVRCPSSAPCESTTGRRSSPKMKSRAFERKFPISSNGTRNCSPGARPDGHVPLGWRQSPARF
jgi:malate/lactate dehydrogenase